MTQKPSAFTYASLALAFVALGVVLHFNLLVATLAACATYALASTLPRTWLLRKTGHRAQAWASVVVAAVPVLVLVAAGLSLTYLSNHANTAHAEVMSELSRIIAQWRDKLPAVLASHLPQGPETLKPWLADVVKSQAEMLKGFGKSSAHGLLMCLVGVVIGLLLANGAAVESRAPLAAAVCERARRLQQTFSAIVMAQFWIAAINTALTAVFFYAVLPLMDVQMPYAPTLLALTFFAGMLPVAGNLLCNTVTTIVALSVGPLVAIASLVFLIVIHKLEYIINARVVGSRMRMAAWEILAAMFVFEAVFGVAGLVAAPFFYAYLKAELRDLGWV